MTSQPLDCLVIGAGPAGLVAALYLARFRRHVGIVDAGHSRAELIPSTHNYPGFPQGISGMQLLQRLREQTFQYDMPIYRERVTALTRSGLFTARIDNQNHHARTVLLTTGVVDRSPALATQKQWRQWTREGLIRWCPICDGHEGMDKELGLIGTADSALEHAMFLRSYTTRLTVMMSPGGAPLSETHAARLRAEKIRVVTSRPTVIEPAPNHKIAVQFEGSPALEFDALYPMLGSEPQSNLATTLGASCDDIGELLVDEHQRTSVPGLYAAGDLVKALNQMSVGMAHAAIAATAIHNSLDHNRR